MKDSGMSDSAFFKFQERVQNKMKKFSADLEVELEEELTRQRFKRNTGRVNKKTLWERLISWITKQNYWDITAAMKPQPVQHGQAHQGT